MRLPNFLYILISLLLVVASCNNSKDKSGQQNTDGQQSGNQSEKPDSVLAALNKLITSDPGNYVHYLNRAKYFGGREQYDLALQDLDRANKIDSTKADVYQYKGEMFFDREMVSEAYNEFKNCLRFDALNEECLLKKSGIDIVLGNYEVAREHINEVLKKNEYNPYAYYLRGRMYKAMGDTTLAASSYKTAIEVDPDYYDAYIEVGLLYASMKNDLAKEYYNSAIAIKPRSVEAWYNKAMFLQETGFRKKERYREALTCYDSIQKIEPGFVAANFNKGYIFLEYLQVYDSASFYFTKAIQSYPQYFQAYYNRGLCYESIGKKKEAEADYRAALSIKPDYDDAASSLDRLLRH